MELNEFNHCVQRLESAAAYEVACSTFCEHLRDMCATVQDAITGIQLRVEDQTLQIKPDFSRGVELERWVSAPAIKDLAPLLLTHESNREHGAHEVAPAVIEAGPGTGKVRPAGFSVSSLKANTEGLRRASPPLLAVCLTVQLLPM